MFHNAKNFLRGSIHLNNEASKHVCLALSLASKKHSRVSPIWRLSNRLEFMKNKNVFSKFLVGPFIRTRMFVASHHMAMRGRKRFWRRIRKCRECFFFFPFCWSAAGNSSSESLFSGTHVATVSGGGHAVCETRVPCFYSVAPKKFVDSAEIGVTDKRHSCVSHNTTAIHQVVCKRTQQHRELSWGGRPQDVKRNCNTLRPCELCRPFPTYTLNI
jgi:hypothetical protein